MVVSSYGCGAGPKGRGVFPDAKKYLDEYVEFANKVGRPVSKDTMDKLTAVLGNTDSLHSRVAGWCEPSDAENLIVIDKTFWANADWTEKEALFLHELGHCLGYRVHRLDRLPGTGMPDSIMYPSVIYYTWESNHDDYLMELVEGSR